MTPKKRVVHGKPPRMEEVAPWAQSTPKLIGVLVISKDRSSKTCHMNSQLVGAACHRKQVD
jgi:hypothetical protein